MYQPGKVANPARGQLNRENSIPLSPCVPENLVSRDGFSRPVYQLDKTVQFWRLISFEASLVLRHTSRIVYCIQSLILNTMIEVCAGHDF